MARRAQRRRDRDARAEEVTGTGSSTPPGAPGAGQPGTSRGRLPALGRVLLRPSRHQLVLALVLGLVAMGVVMQVRAQNADDTYATARRADLVQLLDGLSAETRRLEDELGGLERTRDELRTGADSERVAREQAARRAEELSILAGTAAAEGPGIRLRVSAPPGQLSAQVMVNAVSELRDAGAEVIEIDDRVRVGTDTWFADGPDGPVVDGRALGTSTTVEAIGDPHALEEAVRFRGGLVSEVTGAQIGGRVDVVQEELLVVDSVREPPADRYAEPQPSR